MCNKMAKFNGEVTFRVKFKDLGVPVGFGMTNSIRVFTYKVASRKISCHNINGSFF